MSADNVLGWEIVLKISNLPSKLRFSAKCSFFGQSLSRGHYQATYQPPEGVYLLNVKVQTTNRRMFSKRFAHGSIRKRGDTTLLLKSHRRCIYHSTTNLFWKVLHLWTLLYNWALCIGRTKYSTYLKYSTCLDVLCLLEIIYLIYSTCLM